MKNEVVLAIESAIAGGSLALIVDGEASGRWNGGPEKSRSEEILARAYEMLEGCSMEVSRLTRIAVSNGPGSYTGIRIGIATASGLARARDIPCVGVPLLKAVCDAHETGVGRIAVVPIGRNGLSWEYWPAGDAEGPRTTGSGNFDEFLTFTALKPRATILAHSDVFDLYNEIKTFEDTKTVQDIGRDLAVQVGLASVTVESGPEPFYARDTPPKAAW